MKKWLLLAIGAFVLLILLVEGIRWVIPEINQPAKDPLRDLPDPLEMEDPILKGLKIQRDKLLEEIETARQKKELEAEISELKNNLKRLKDGVDSSVPTGKLEDSVKGSEIVSAFSQWLKSVTKKSTEPVAQTPELNQESEEISKD